MESDRETPTGRQRPHVWLVSVRVLVILAMLFVAVGASGIFAFQLCPSCPPRRPDYYVPAPDLPEELDRDTKTKQ